MYLTATELAADIDRITEQYEIAESNYYDSVRRADNRRIAYWSNQVEWLTRAIRSRERDLRDQQTDEPTQLDLI